MDKNFILGHRMKTAEDYESAGKHLHAIQIYKSILEEEPSYSDAVIKTAEIYRKIGNIDAASDLMSDFLGDFPEDRKIRFYFSEFLLNNAEWDKAVEVLEYFPPEEEPVSLFFRGYAHFMLKEYEISRLNFISFVSISEPGDLFFEAFFLAAKIDIETGAYENALINLKKAEPGLSNFWEYNYLSALCYFNMGMHAHAVSFIEKSLSLNSREVAHFNLAGKIHLKLGDYPKAEKHFRKYIEMKENVTADTYAYLGEACLHNSKVSEALELFDKALAEDPENQTAANGKKNASGIINRNKVSDG